MISGSSSHALPLHVATPSPSLDSPRSARAAAFDKPGAGRSVRRDRSDQVPTSALPDTSRSRSSAAKAAPAGCSAPTSRRRCWSSGPRAARRFVFVADHAGRRLPAGDRRSRPGAERARAPHRLRHRHPAGRPRGRRGARRAAGRADLLAPRDRLQPADPCRPVDPGGQRADRDPGQPRSLAGGSARRGSRRCSGPTTTGSTPCSMPARRAACPRC